MTNTIESATVDTLTATVRVMKVGSRQITQSVAKQLDRAPVRNINVIGRIRFTGDNHSTVRVIGQHKETGELVTASMNMSALAPVDLSDFKYEERPIRPRGTDHRDIYEFGDDTFRFSFHNRHTRLEPVDEWDLGPRVKEIEERASANYRQWVARLERFNELRSYPLIVLAGLR